MARQSSKDKVSQEDQYQNRRRDLLQQAGLLLGELGPDNFSLSKLADRLGITSAALYYYFKSKQDLLFECYKFSFDLADIALDKSLAEGGDAAVQLERFIRYYMLAALQDLQPTMLLRETADLQPVYAQKIRGLRKALHSRARKLIAQGIRQKVIAPCNPALTVVAIFGALSDLLKAYNPKGSISAKVLAEQISAQLARGFLVPQSQLSPKKGSGRKRQASLAVSGNGGRSSLAQ